MEQKCQYKTWNFKKNFKTNFMHPNVALLEFVIWFVSFVWNRPIERTQREKKKLLMSWSTWRFWWRNLLNIRHFLDVFRSRSTSGVTPESSVEFGEIRFFFDIRTFSIFQHNCIKKYNSLWVYILCHLLRKSRCWAGFWRPPGISPNNRWN